MCDFQRRGEIDGFFIAPAKFLLLAAAKVSVLAGQFIAIVREVALGVIFFERPFGRGEEEGGGWG